MAISSTQIELIRRNADVGSPLAQVTLGWMYLKGRGVARDYGKAFLWYEKAAEQGDVRALEGLRIMYHKGIGVKQNSITAAQWAVKAAQAGNVQSQANLGISYWRGQGLTRDPVLAHAWLTIASAYGYEHWRHNLTRYLVRRSLTKEELYAAQIFVSEWQEQRRRKLAE